MNNVAHQNGSVKVDQVLADLEYIPTHAERRESNQLFALMDLTEGDKGLSFPDQIAKWGRLLRSLDYCPRYVWMAEKLAELAKRAEIVHATTPEQFEDRVAVLTPNTLERAVMTHAIGTVERVAREIAATVPGYALLLAQAANDLTQALNHNR
jgi:hypothetical protein